MSAYGDWVHEPVDERVRQTLLWLSERLDQVDKAAGGGDPWAVPHPCATCSHSRYAHVVVADATMEGPAWPCVYPKILGAPEALCACPDFEPMGDPDE